MLPLRGIHRLLIGVLAAGTAVAVPLGLAAVDHGRATQSTSAGSVSTPSALAPTFGPESRLLVEPGRTLRPTVAPAPPRELTSPALGIRAPVVPIDATDGVLLPPEDPRTLGWWRHGALPGSGTGRVLVTGHTVHTGGGIFDDLDELDSDDLVRLRTATGTFAYRVRSSQYLTVGEFAEEAARLLRQDGPERLVLVTCEGWNGTTYDGSTVVIAEPVTQ